MACPCASTSDRHCGGRLRAAAASPTSNRGDPGPFGGSAKAVPTRQFFSSADHRTMREYLKFYIDGQWVDPVELRRLDVENPATEQPCGTIALGSAADVDRAASAA